MKKNLIIAFIVILVLGVGGIILFKNKIFAPKSVTQPTSESQTSKEEKQKEAEKINYEEVFTGKTAVCELFPKEKIEELSGKKFLSVKPSLSQTSYFTEYACEYLEENLPHEYGTPLEPIKEVAIQFIKGDTKGLRKITEDTENQIIKKDNEIPFEHWLVYDKNGKFGRLHGYLDDDFDLIVNTWQSTLSSEEAEKFAKNFALYLVNFVHGKTQSNQGVLPNAEGENETGGGGVPLPQEEDIVNNFFSLINSGDADKAVSMMKVKDDSEKQAWAVQFAAFNYVQVLKMEKVNENEWTDNRHFYKITLDVIMKPESGSAPIPYYGYQNGQNIRWITLEKEDDIWKVAEIATGP